MGTTGGALDGQVSVAGRTHLLNDRIVGCWMQGLCWKLDGLGEIRGEEPSIAAEVPSPAASKRCRAPKATVSSRHS